MADRVSYLHGDLDLRIIQARDLPNMDLVSEHVRRCFTLCDACKTPTTRDHDSTAAGTDDGRVRHKSGDKRLDHHRKIITSDPYVTVCVPQATVARTRVISNTQNPYWNERFHIPLAHPVANLEFQVKDNDLFGAEVIGVVRIPAEEIATGKHISQWFPVSGARAKARTALRLEMTFTPFEGNPVYRTGIAGDPEQLGVRHTYFPLRRGGSATLYQDAHVPDGLLPDIELDGGKIYRHEKCWEDICHAIVEAHHMVYLVGWSIYHKVKLIREPTRPLPRGGDLTLGELLKYKSEEGVRVLMLVWDDRTSHDKFFIQTVSIPPPIKV